MRGKNNHTPELVNLASGIPASIEALQAKMTQVAASMGVLKRVA
jgi:hypothetical protein